MGRSRGISPAKERPAKATAADEIQQFHRAKQAKDFARSDRIRESLRKAGVDPDPSAGSAPAMSNSWGNFGGSWGNGGGGGWGSNSGNALDRELSEWYAAHDQKNWAVADSIRKRLRAQGIEP